MSALLVHIAAQCQDPGNNPNLQRVQDAGYVSNTVVYFQCNSGYDLSGASALTCLSNGVWSAPAPVCSPRSGKYESISFPVQLFLFFKNCNVNLKRKRLFKKQLFLSRRKRRFDVQRFLFRKGSFILE